MLMCSVCVYVRVGWEYVCVEVVRGSKVLVEHTIQEKRASVDPAGNMKEKFLLLHALCCCWCRCCQASASNEIVYQVETF